MNTVDSSAKDKPIKDVDKVAQEKSLKKISSKGLSCIKSGASFEKASKQRLTTGNAIENLSCIPSNPSLQSSTSSRIQNTDLNILKPPREHTAPQNPKFKLKLFPLDEITQKRMEEENHYPYLELTITPKKKIASVIRHLTLKWGNLKNALEEELVLFPHNYLVDSLESYKMWSLMDAGITTVEVYAAIGNPAVFKLRYGWLNILGLKFSNMPPTCHIPVNESISSENQKKDVRDCGNDVSFQISRPLPDDLIDTREMAYPMKRFRTADNQMESSYNTKLSWIDCESNMSFGALFSQVEATEAKLCHQAAPKQASMSFDSFDAAIAAHIARYKPENHATTISQPSILDAEETCNPFSFRSFTSLSKNSRVQSGINPATSHNQDEKTHMMESRNSPSPPVEPSQERCCVAALMTEYDAQPIQDHLQASEQVKEEMQVDSSVENNVVDQFVGLDMHWPSSSAGPWQFLASSQQMISSDSNGIASLCKDLF